MTDEERIAKKAHELWEAEGHPHGRDQAHWDQAKEIIALQDSAGAALLPRDAGAKEPVEERTVALDNEGEAPNLTDTGEHDLTSTAREPAVTAPSPKVTAPSSKVKSAAKKVTSGGDAAKISKAVVGPAKAARPAKDSKAK